MYNNMCISWWVYISWFCLSSTVALHCTAALAKTKADIAKKSSFLLIVSLVETALVEITLVGEHLYCSIPFNPGTASWLAELRNLLTLDAFARPSNRMLPIPKDNVRDKSFSLESGKENKKVYKTLVALERNHVQGYNKLAIYSWVMTLDSFSFEKALFINNSLIELDAQVVLPASSSRKNN